MCPFSHYVTAVIVYHGDIDPIPRSKCHDLNFKAALLLNVT